MTYQLRDVGRSFSSRSEVVQSLSDLNFDIARGERIALIGPSGAGKSTLLRLLQATLPPSCGAIFFEGRDVAARSPSELRTMRRRIGTIYQRAYLVPSLTALENTLTGALGSWSTWRTLRNAIAPITSDVDRARSALQAVGLEAKQGARADELSGGQQQRLAIARVLMQDPEVILADEPFASLDPTLSDTIAALLLEKASAGRTLIVTLHDVAIALRYFPRIIALKSGSLRFNGSAKDVTEAVLDELYHDGDLRDSAQLKASTKETRLRSRDAICRNNVKANRT
ncbi:MAG: phosphonate ABC transporter ATP-binding protein [Polyangiales bacterium]